MGAFLESFLSYIGVTLLALTVAFYAYAKYKYGTWKRLGIQYIEPSFPFGNMQELIFRTQQIGLRFQEFYIRFKRLRVPYGGFYFVTRPELLIIDPEVIKKMLLKDFDHFDDKGNYHDEKNDPLSAHLFAIGGKKWKNLRVKLTPTFTSGKMKMMFQTLVDTSVELNNILAEASRKDEPLDIKTVLARFTTDVIGSCAFGIECNCLQTPDSDFLKYGSNVFEPKGLDIYRGIIAQLFPGFMKFFKLRGLNKNITDFFMGVVKDTVKYREENNISRKDFLHLLLQLKNRGKVSEDDAKDDGIAATSVVSDGKTLTIDEIAAQCFVFFLAGFETSSTAMTFSLFELVQNQDIQTKLREEILDTLKQHNGEITYEAIMSMKYLDKVIHESLRKYPPLPFLNRMCTKNYTLPDSKIVLRKGQIIRIPVYGIHHDPDYYPNPQIFDPERFSEEEKNKRPGFTFMPFGEGPRLCIGLRFGLMQAKVGLTVLLRNYRFTLNEKTKTPLKMTPSSFTLSTQDGIWLDLHKA